MKVAFLGDNGVGPWHINIFGNLPNIEFFVSDRNKHKINIDKEKLYKLSATKNILLALKNPIEAYKRLKYNNFDKKLDFHYFELKQLVEKNYFDFVIVKSDRSLYTMSSLKKKYNNFKLIYWFPATIPLQDIFDKRSYYIRKYSFDIIDHFISITKTAKEILLFEGIDEKKVTPIYPGIIDTKVFYKKDKQKAKNLLNFPKNRIELIFVGKLTSWKGPYTLLYALKLLKEKYDIHLHFLGKGEQKNTLKKVAQELNIVNNITFYGFVEHKKLVDFYNACDIFILPSLPTINWEEQFGFVVAEAMACGLPTIVSKVGGLPEVVDFEEDLLFTPGDFQDLKQKIEKLIIDKNLYNELSYKCHNRSMNYYESIKNAKLIEQCLRNIK